MSVDRKKRIFTLIITATGEQRNLIASVTQSFDQHAYRVGLGRATSVERLRQFGGKPPGAVGLGMGTTAGSRSRVHSAALRAIERSLNNQSDGISGELHLPRLSLQHISTRRASTNNIIRLFMTFFTLCFTASRHSTQPVTRKSLPSLATTSSGNRPAQR